MNTPLIVLIISFFVALAMSGILFVIARTYPKTIRGLNEWSVAALTMSLALPLFIARDLIPDLFSIVLANLMILLGFMLMNAGTRKFTDQQSKTRPALLSLFVLTYVALFVWFTYAQPDIGMRVAITSAFTLVVIADQLIAVLKDLPATTGRNLLVLSLAILVGVRALRLGGLVFGFVPSAAIFENAIPQLGYVALPAFMIPLGTISLILLASEKLHLDLEFLSRHDDLTQCLNKRSAMAELQREIARARRYGNKLAVMLIDLDNFKAINDTRGHLEGDRVLVDFAAKAKASLRATDQLARFGGDEFMALLPYADRRQATRVASRLREAGQAGHPVPWSASIGIAEWLHEDDTQEALLTRADQALYRAKALGRDGTPPVEAVPQAAAELN